MLRTLLAALLCCVLLAHAQASEPIDGQFKNYPAEVTIPKKNAAPKLVKGTDYWNYRSAITGMKDEEPDFAGHYIVVPIGCGTECVGGVLIDVLTGSLYELPQFPYEAVYKLESRLFFANCMEVDGAPSWLTQNLYEWNEKKREFILIVNAPPNTYRSTYCDTE